MQITNYFDSAERAHWLDKIGLCEWAGGKYLHELLENGSFFDMAGDDLTPWVGFVYTYPQFRGKRYFGLLLDEALRLAKAQGFDKLYISTDHIGLYEKYGCEFLTEMTDVRGDMSRVYFKEVMK